MTAHPSLLVLEDHWCGTCAARAARAALLVSWTLQDQDADGSGLSLEVLALLARLPYEHAARALAAMVKSGAVRAVQPVREVPRYRLARVPAPAMRGA